MRFFVAIVFLTIGLGLAACGGTETALEPPPPPSVAESAIEASGTIYYVNQVGQPDFGIMSIDMASNQESTFFDIPDAGWAYEIDASDATNEIVFSYTPPPFDGPQFYDRIGLYTLPLDGGDVEPTPLIVPQQANEFFYDPIWMPDGRGIVYAHYVVIENNMQNYELTVEKYDIESGQSTVLAQNGFWPDVSPDGRLVTYLDINFETQSRSLWIVDINSENARELVGVEAFGDLDTPVFSPDGEWIYFVTIPKAKEANIWDRITGVRVAEAHGNHDTPGDWYRIPVAGGTPQKVTAESVIMLYGAFSPDETVFGYATMDGLYLLDQVANVYELRYESRSMRNFTWGE